MLAAVLLHLPSFTADRTESTGASFRRDILVGLLQLGAQSYHLHGIQPRLSSRLPEAFVALRRWLQESPSLTYRRTDYLCSDTRFI